MADQHKMTDDDFHVAWEEARPLADAILALLADRSPATVTMALIAAVHRQGAPELVGFATVLLNEMGGTFQKRPLTARQKLHEWMSDRLDGPQFAPSPAPSFGSLTPEEKRLWSQAIWDTGAKMAQDRLQARFPEGVPEYVTRREAADLVSITHFPVSHRSIERWPLPQHVANGRALLKSADVLAYAKERLGQLAGSAIA